MVKGPCTGCCVALGYRREVGLSASGNRRRTERHLQVRASQPDLVLEAARTLAQGARGWITMVPHVPSGSEPAPAGLLSSLVSPPLHEAPLCTWLPGRPGRRGRRPDELGIQHATGTKAAARLADAGFPVPPGWRVRQDHPRRGLVVEPPVGTAPEEELAWLLAAGNALCRAPCDNRWDVVVHDRA